MELLGNSQYRVVHCGISLVFLRIGSSGSGLSGSGPSTSGSQVNCDRALEVVRNVRDRLRGNTHDEQKRNFAPYGVGKKRKMGVSTFTPASRKKECVSWSPRFVWLSDKDARSVPCTVASKEVLVEAGLGEKKVDILDVDCSPQEFHDQLIVVFPKCGEVTRETAYSRMTEQ